VREHAGDDVGACRRPLHGQVIGHAALIDLGKMQIFYFTWVLVGHATNNWDCLSLVRIPSKCGVTH